MFYLVWVALIGFWPDGLQGRLLASWGSAEPA
jgi:hypothetical protein